MNRQEHWNHVYRTKSPLETSWHQARPTLSLEMIAAAAPPKDGGVLDVGGGSSVLVDCLLDAGYSRLGVLDLSGAALAHSHARLGERAAAVEWFETDVTNFEPPHRFAVWHDRATFHFLTSADDRRAYIATLQRALEPGGCVIIATFAPDGPLKCSGLDVRRYDAAAMSAELGAEFALQEVRPEIHRTPQGFGQSFLYFRFRHSP
jgi:SAM-dependent methyltransferase